MSGYSKNQPYLHFNTCASLILILFLLSPKITSAIYCRALQLSLTNIEHIRNSNQQFRQANKHGYPPKPSDNHQTIKPPPSASAGPKCIRICIRGVQFSEAVGPRPHRRHGRFCPLHMYALGDFSRMKYAFVCFHRKR